MMPDLQRLPPGEKVRPFVIGDTRWRFDEYEVASQRLTSHHFEFVEGELHRLWVPFRYVWRAELDLMAQAGGSATAGVGG